MPKVVSSWQTSRGVLHSCSKQTAPYPPYALSVEPFEFNPVGSSVSTTMMEPFPISKMLPPRLGIISCLEGCERKRQLRLNVVKLRLNSDCCHRPDWFPVPIEAKREPAHARVMYAQAWAMNVATHLGPRLCSRALQCDAGPFQQYDLNL